MTNPHITSRQKMVTQAISATLTGLSFGGKALSDISRRWMDDVEVLTDIPYKDGFERQHKLDVYRPKRQKGVLPALLYIHGGGFGLLSKETHWMFGAGFARQGYVVFSIDYTLSGTAPFPAAVKDSFAAYQWVTERAHHYDADPTRMVISGESAGANLSLSVMMATCWERPEDWAKPVWEAAGRVGVPKAVLPACGMLQVSNPERYLEMEKIPGWMRDRIAVVCRRYLPDASRDPVAYELADPLRFLEEAPPPDRPLPGIYAVCGTRDVIKDDTRRLEGALRRFEGGHEVEWYPGGIHAFHAFIWQENARKAWLDQLEFLKNRV